MSKLQEARLAKGISCKKLADLSNVSKRTIEKYESGELDIMRAAVGKVIAIADALEVDIKEIL